MDELVQRMRRLPTELIDTIYDLTFTAEPAVHKIDANGLYKPSALLAVDRASRKAFAPLYYGQGSTFHIKDDARLSISSKWLTSVPIEPQCLLHDIRIRFYGDGCGNYRGYTTTQQRRDVEDLKRGYMDFFQMTLPGVRAEHMRVGVEVDYEGSLMWSKES